MKGRSSFAKATEEKGGTERLADNKTLKTITDAQESEH
jgi:hypothetical protein